MEFPIQTTVRVHIGNVITAFQHRILCFRFLSMVIRTYLLFFRQIFIMHLHFYIFTLPCSAQMRMSNIKIIIINGGT